MFESSYLHNCLLKLQENSHTMRLKFLINIENLSIIDVTFILTLTDMIILNKLRLADKLIILQIPQAKFE